MLVLFYEERCIYAIESSEEFNKFVCIDYSSKPFVTVREERTGFFINLDCLSLITPRIKDELTCKYITNPYYIKDFDSKKLGNMPANICNQIEMEKKCTLLSITVNDKSDMLVLIEKTFELKIDTCRVTDFLFKNGFSITNSVTYYSIFMSKNYYYLDTLSGRVVFRSYIYFLSHKSDNSIMPRTYELSDGCM